MKEKGESAFDDVVQEDSSGKKKTEAEEQSPGGPNSSPPQEGSSSEVSDSDPAFPFAEVTQQPMYTRPETWDALEDAKYYAEGELREEFGVRNVETREFDEAIMQLVLEELDPDDIAEKVVEIRGFDP